MPRITPGRTMSWYPRHEQLGDTRGGTLLPHRTQAPLATGMDEIWLVGDLPLLLPRCRVRGPGRTSLTRDSMSPIAWLATLGKRAARHHLQGHPCRSAPPSRFFCPTLALGVGLARGTRVQGQHGPIVIRRCGRTNQVRESHTSLGPWSRWRSSWDVPGLFPPFSS